MSRVLRVTAMIVVVCGTFVGGVLFNSWMNSRNPGIEDYALANILNELAYRQFLEQKRYEEMLQITDVNLNVHLSQLRRNFASSSVSAEFSGTRTRTLARVANLWDTHPPFQTQDFQQAKEKPWFAEWEREHQENIALIKSAQAECRRTQCDKERMN